MVNRSYVLGLIGGYLPKDINLELVNSQDGLPLTTDQHTGLIKALEDHHHVPISHTGQCDGEIQFTTGLAHDKAGGLRFAADPEEDGVVWWISFDD